MEWRPDLAGSDISRLRTGALGLPFFFDSAIFVMGDSVFSNALRRFQKSGARQVTLAGLFTPASKLACIPGFCPRKLSAAWLGKVASLFVVLSLAEPAWR